MKLDYNTDPEVPDSLDYKCQTEGCNEAAAFHTFKTTPNQSAKKNTWKREMIHHCLRCYFISKWKENDSST